MDYDSVECIIICTKIALEFQSVTCFELLKHFMTEIMSILESRIGVKIQNIVVCILNFPYLSIFLLISLFER